MRHFRILITAGCFLMSASLLAQNNEKRQKGVATIIQDPYESPKAAQERGIEDAQIAAIESAFPYYIESEGGLVIEDDNVDYVMKSNKKVHGIWIKHERDPECVPRTVTSKGEQVNQYTCTVVGLIREVKNAPLKFVASPLGAPYRKAKKEVFESEERLYVHFQSSVDGYISIFFRSAGSVNRILPYPQMNTAEYNMGLKVRAGENYIFYDEKHSSIETLDILPVYVMPLELWTDKSQGEEKNTMYVLFSEREIPPPPMDNASIDEQFTYPAEMDAYSFERWLEDRRLSDLSLQEISYQITVRAPR